MKNKRLPGITIIGFALVSIGTFFFVKILTMFFMVERNMIDIYDPILAIGLIVLGRGLLNLKEWTRSIVDWASRISLVVIPLAMLFKRLFILEGIMDLLISVVVIFYLTQPVIKEHFKSK